MLPFSLHGYRTSVHTSTGANPFSLVYDMEVVLPWRSNSRQWELSWTVISKRIKQAFDKKVCPREFQEGDLVLKKMLSFQSDTRGKWTPNYEGMYVVKSFFFLVIQWLLRLWMVTNLYVLWTPIQSRSNMILFFQISSYKYLNLQFIKILYNLSLNVFFILLYSMTREINRLILKSSSFTFFFSS